MCRIPDKTIGDDIVSWVAYTSLDLDVGAQDSVGRTASRPGLTRLQMIVVVAAGEIEFEFGTVRAGYLTQK